MLYNNYKGIDISENMLAYHNSSVTLQCYHITKERNLQERLVHYIKNICAQTSVTIIRKTSSFWIGLKDVCLT